MKKIVEQRAQGFRGFLKILHFRGNILINIRGGGNRSEALGPGNQIRHVRVQVGQCKFLEGIAKTGRLVVKFLLLKPIE